MKLESEAITENISQVGITTTQIIATGQMPECTDSLIKQGRQLCC